MNDTVGIYYELPDGRIVYTFGFSKIPNYIIRYYFNDGSGPREISNEEFQTWIPRRDLKDWPDSKDPVLPYEFDLHFDIKRESELKYLLENKKGLPIFKYDLLNKLMKNYFPGGKL